MIITIIFILFKPLNVSLFLWTGTVSSWKDSTPTSTGTKMSWAVQQKSSNVHRLPVWILMMPRQQNWSCSQGVRTKILPVNHSDTSQLQASAVSLCMQIRAFSSECVTLPCDAAWAAIQEDMVGWLHMSWRKHLLAFTFPGWYDRGVLAGGCELSSEKQIKVEKFHHQTEMTGGANASLFVWHVARTSRVQWFKGHGFLNNGVSSMFGCNNWLKLGVSIQRF